LKRVLDNGENMSLNKIDHHNYMKERLKNNMEAKQRMLKKANLYKREKRKELSIWLYNYKSNQSCSICGEKDPACLDFHHKNKSEKKFEIMVKRKIRTIEEVLEEIKKCDIVCANCHRKIHKERFVYMNERSSVLAGK